jgi:hypothetical protein
VRFTVSPELIRSLSAMPPSAVQVSVVFHSGAALEAICGELLLELD